VRSAKSLPLSLDVDSQLAELSGRCEVQRRELHDAAGALSEARSRARRAQRQLAQLKARLQISEERVAELEEQAATTYALARDRETHGAVQREQELTEARQPLNAEIASLRDALAAALERERAFRRVEAELRRRLAAQTEGNGQNGWDAADPRANLGTVDAEEAVATGLPLVP
jgi:chromosome segregation ATPase